MTASYAASGTEMGRGKYIYTRTDGGPDPRVMLLMEEIWTCSGSSTCHSQRSAAAVRIQGGGSSWRLMKRRRRANLMPMTITPYFAGIRVKWHYQS